VGSPPTSDRASSPRSRGTQVADDDPDQELAEHRRLSPALRHEAAGLGGGDEEGERGQERTESLGATSSQHGEHGDYPDLRAGAAAGRNL